jgi:methenyltetrahydromethanopterin cyclohydrolase
MSATFTLNEQAWRLADDLAAQADQLRIGVARTSIGVRLLDCGIAHPGGLKAGLGLARVCLADLAEVTLAPATLSDLPGPQVQVSSDQPVLACMASQYAGWAIKVGKFFAMGSGPMRAAYGKEDLFDHIPGREQATRAVGVLETRKTPGDEVLAHLAEKLRLEPDRITLLMAPTASLAGTVQIVARSLETALHKLYELKFDLNQVISGHGTAPLPPVAADDLGAIGRTNDAILYGGRVTLWVRASDDQLAKVGPRVPASASPDYGAPFAELFARYNHDFYKIDPMLFSPAMICFHNLASGRSHVFGQPDTDVLKRSFLGGN